MTTISITINININSFSNRDKVPVINITTSSIGFTTANRRTEDTPIRTVEVISDNRIETAFNAVAECVEEAIYNSMIAADTVTGFNGKEPVTVRALNEFLPGALCRAKAMAAGGI